MGGCMSLQDEIKSQNSIYNLEEELARELKALSTSFYSSEGKCVLDTNAKRIIMTLDGVSSVKDSKRNKSLSV